MSYSRVPLSPSQAKKAAATKTVEQPSPIEAMDEDEDEAGVEAEAGRRGRSLSTLGGGGAVRNSMAMSPELSADTPSLSLDGGGMGLQQAHEPAPNYIPAVCPQPALNQPQPAPAYPNLPSASPSHRPHGLLPSLPPLPTAGGQRVRERAAGD